MCTLFNWIWLNFSITTIEFKYLAQVPLLRTHSCHFPFLLHARCAAPTRPNKISGNKKPDIIPGKTPPQNNGNSEASVTGEDKTKVKVDDEKAAKGK